MQIVHLEKQDSREQRCLIYVSEKRWPAPGEASSDDRHNDDVIDDHDDDDDDEEEEEENDDDDYKHDYLMRVDYGE